jgi:hypothetical protein
MIQNVFILGSGTGLSYILSKILDDGILGGLVIMIVLLVTLRILLGSDRKSLLNTNNAWITLGVLGCYSMIVMMLPRCYIDRYGSRFCRETNPDTSGSGWLSGLFISFFLFSL